MNLSKKNYITTFLFLFQILTINRWDLTSEVYQYAFDNLGLLYKFNHLTKKDVVKMRITEEMEKKRKEERLKQLECEKSITAKRKKISTC